MKETNNLTAQALTMYKETVSPSKENLMAILSQIPEIKSENKGRAVRSPYIWLELTEFVMLCFVILAISPTFIKIINDPFYQTDKQVQIFESEIQHQDYQDDILNSGL